jgi:hypothetical protein
MLIRDVMFIGLLGCVGAAAPTRAHAAGPADYVVVEQWPIPNGGFGKAVVVKAKPTEADLRAVGDRLRQDTKADRNAFIFIYDDRTAAMDRKRAMADTLSKTALAHHDRHMVGKYFRNANTGFHLLEMTPDGLDGKAISVKY